VVASPSSTPTATAPIFMPSPITPTAAAMVHSFRDSGRSCEGEYTYGPTSRNVPVLGGKACLRGRSARIVRSSRTPIPT